MRNFVMPADKEIEKENKDNNQETNKKYKLIPSRIKCAMLYYFIFALTSTFYWVLDEVSGRNACCFSSHELQHKHTHTHRDYLSIYLSF